MNPSGAHSTSWPLADETSGKREKSMAKLDVEDLISIREKTAQAISLRHKKAPVTITVHMGTCGIAAGARDVMSALLEERSQSDRSDIHVITSGCMGKEMCSSEPLVTVEVKGSRPVVYQHMDPVKIRRVFQSHVLRGDVQTDFVLKKS
jgi:NADP-reducing hydrogenase subunit HndB